MHAQMFSLRRCGDSSRLRVGVIGRSGRSHADPAAGILFVPLGPSRGRGRCRLDWAPPWCSRLLAKMQQLPPLPARLKRTPGENVSSLNSNATEEQELPFSAEGAAAAAASTAAATAAAAASRARGCLSLCVPPLFRQFHRRHYALASRLCHPFFDFSFSLPY